MNLNYLRISSILLFPHSINLFQTKTFYKINVDSYMEQFQIIDAHELLPNNKYSFHDK